MRRGRVGSLGLVNSAASRSSTHPHGREAVRQALIDAATELFATRTPDEVTVRELADHAGVNHGLVHQYFGSKQGLVEETITYLAGELLPAATDAVNVGAALPILLDRLVARSAYVRLITWSLLGSGGMPELGHDFPALRRLMERSNEELGDTPPRIDPRVAAAVVTSLMFGWVMYRDYVDAAVDLSDLSQQEIHRGISDSVQALIRWYTYASD